MLIEGKSKDNPIVITLHGGPGTPIPFSVGCRGLYGGLDVDDIHKRKNLEVGQKILDYMCSTELIANLFRISQTEEKLRKDEVDNAKTATG